MEFFQNIVSVAALRKSALAVAYVTATLALSCGSLACSAAPVKLQCSEIKARIEYSDLTGDQLRFAQQELEDCQGKQKAAEQKDSSWLEGTEKRFTPASEIESDSLPVGSGRLP
jgi:hypothetical protein